VGLWLGHARQDLTQRAEGVLMGVSVEVKDSGATGLVAHLEGLGQAVTIGVHEGAGNYPDGTPVTVVGARHEFGDGVDERSWLRGYLDAGGTAELADAAQGQIGEVVDGADPDTVGEKVGEVAVAGIVARMDRGIPGAAGGPARDLQDTGQLVDSITYEVAP
jgi:hypothetical protein